VHYVLIKKLGIEDIKHLLQTCSALNMSPKQNCLRKHTAVSSVVYTQTASVTTNVTMTTVFVHC